jgi:tetratricopeptide (TPR) repeat protein
MISTAIESLQERTRTHLSVFDEPGLRRFLRASWPVEDLVELLEHSDTDVAKIAATCLGTCGDSRAASALTAVLSHEDAIVSTMAEFALWTIWFGDCGPEAEAKLRKAGRLDYPKAVVLLDDLVGRFPTWAEAYNQRAIANYLNRRFVSAIDDCKEALAINPRHFGALAGLGHAYAQVGLYQEAARCYQKALNVHPRMDGIRQALRTVRNLLRSGQLA